MLATSQLAIHFQNTCRLFLENCYIQWNLSNPDTNGAEESVSVREVSSVQRLQEWYLGWEEVSCLGRCPRRERGSIFSHISLSHSSLAGRPVPQLPSLSSSARNSVTTTTTSQSTLHPHSNKCPPPTKSSSATSSLATSSSLACNDVCGDSGECERWEEGECDSLEEAGWKPLPDDAQFPKGGGGGLFFADCLSSRHKYRDDII